MHHVSGELAVLMCGRVEWGDEERSVVGVLVVRVDVAERLRRKRAALHFYIWQ